MSTSIHEMFFTKHKSLSSDKIIAIDSVKTPSNSIWQVTLLFYSGIIAIITFFLYLGVRTAKKTSSSSDYAVAGRSTKAAGVSGIIMGALVGGASTVGTVQMAYSTGLSAWWFTLGAGLGCLILGLWFAAPLRNSDLVTIPEFLKQRYGVKVSSLSMIASSAGTFLSVVAQFLAGSALFRTIFPMSETGSAILLGTLILGFIYMGGLKSYSSVGSAKMIALYLTMTLCALTATFTLASPSQILTTLPVNPWLNLFGRGLLKDSNALLSLVAGVFCTQIYIQGIFAASSAETAKKGALIAAMMMPPVGLMGAYIGLSMRTAGIVVEPAMALPYFINTTFPAPIAGLMWGAILITVVGAGAGLSFGIATNLVRDMILPLAGSRLSKRELSISRATVAFIVIAAAITGTFMRGSLILHWSFLSMGLRGAGTLVPLIVAIIWPNRLTPGWALAANAGGLAIMIFTEPLGIPLTPMAAGLLTSATIAAFGMMTFKEGLKN